MSTSIKRIFPLGFPWATQDPFLFCAFHKDNYPKAKEDMSPDASLAGRALGNDFTLKDGFRMYHGSTIPGFPSHPHRGFETVTIVNEGFCDHSDSLGAAGRFGNGDVQWMTAGRGVQHCEMFPLLNTEDRNPLEMFQVWLNLPQKNKFVDPHFAMLWAEDVPMITEDGVKIKLVAGTYKELKAPKPAPDSWAATPENEVLILNIHLENGATFTLPKANGEVNRSIYFYEGDTVTMDQQNVLADSAAELDASFDTNIQNTGEHTAHFLVLQGKPLQEPVAKYGPFVMNTQLEIEQAMQEYRLTQFGGWPWPYSDNVHPRTKGRFALYPDGKEITK